MEVIPIVSTGGGFLSSSAPTLTFYWPGKDAKAVLLGRLLNGLYAS